MSFSQASTLLKLIWRCRPKNKLTITLFFWLFMVALMVSPSAILSASGTAYTVTTLADNADPGSLRWAVANAADNDRIVFAPGLTGEIFLLSDLGPLNSITFENGNSISVVRHGTAGITTGLIVGPGKTLSGDLPGTLTATTTTDGIYGLHSSGVMVLGNITGSVSAEAGVDWAYGLFSIGAMSLNDITDSVTAKAGGSYAHALLSNRAMSLNDITGSVSAEAGGMGAWGLNSSGVMVLGNITGSVSAEAGVNWAYGLFSMGTMSLNDITGSVTAKAGGSTALALLSNQAISLNDITGSVSAEAGVNWAYGLRSNGAITFNHISGSVTAVAKGYAAAGLYSAKSLSGPAGVPGNISGIIEAKANGTAVAVAVKEGMNIRVTGTLKATDTSGGDGAYAIGAGAFDYNNSGNWVPGLAFNDSVILGEGASITGQIDLGGGANTLKLEDSGRLAGDVSNITDLTKTGAGTWKTSGQINSQNLSVTAGTLFVDAPTTHNMGNLTTDLGGQLTAIVRPTTAPAIAANTVTNNGSIHFQLATLLPSGTAFDVLTTTAGISGAGSLLSSSPLLTLTNDGMNIRATKVSYADLPLSTTNARSMADLLNPYITTATGDMAALITRLESVTSVDEFNTCLGELFSQSGSTAMSMDASRLFSLSVQDRIAGVRAQTGQAARVAKTFLNPDDPDTWPLLVSVGNLAGLLNRRPDETPNGVFVKTLAQKGERDSFPGYTGYDHDTTGIIAGFDRVIGKKMLAGLSLGYANNDLDYKDPGASHANVENLGTGLYASFFDRQWYVDALVSGAWNTSQANRNIAFLNRTAQSDQDGYTLGGKLDSGYRFTYDKIGISPLLSGEYMYFQQDGYNESGAGAANLSMDSLTGHSFKTGLGLKLDRSFKSDQWWSLTPELSARWLHEFIDQDHSVQVAMAGMPGQIFSQELAGPKEDALRIKAGLTAFYKTDIALLFHYLGQFEQDAQSHGLSCELQYFF